LSSSGVTVKESDYWKMGEKEIKEECEHIKHDVEKMVDEEIIKVKNKIKNLEEEAQKIGRETENILNNNPKAKEKANKH
jgi:hypothetical protein